MGMLLTVAARNLLQGGRRTVLLALALVMVTALLVVLLSLSRGVNDSMVRAATTLSAGHVNVAGFYKPTAEDTGPIVTDVEALKRIAREKTPGLVYLIDRHRGWAKVVSETSSMFAGLVGIDVDQETRLFETLQLAPESEYVEGGRAEVVGDVRRLREKDTALLFVNQAKRLGVRVGDQLTLRTETLRGQSNTVDLTVGAVARDLGMMSNWSLFLPKSTILGLYNLKPETSGAVMIYLDDITKAEETMAHLRRVYEEAGYQLMDHDPQPFFMKFETVIGQDWTGQKLDLTTWRDEVSFLTWVLAAIDSVSFTLIGILAVIIAIGIMNAMWIAVRERTREVGTLRAIGMSRRRILAMFVLEALLLALAATTLGALTGAGIAAGIDAAAIEVPVEVIRAILMSDTIHLVVDPSQLVGAVVAFTLITAFSALWPAARAARLPPITAIHQTE